MKWLGQYIQSFTARFRNDVYLENLSTTTETSALVVDSDGKISKNVTSGVNLTNGADNRVVTAVGTNGLNAEANLTFDGSTLSVEADANTTANALFIDANSLTTGSAISIDVDDALTASATKSLMLVDYDKSGVTASGQTSVTTGLNINLADAATNDASGFVVQQGIVIAQTMASDQGSCIQYGISVDLSGSDTGLGSTGILTDVQNGGFDWRMMNSADSTEWGTIAVGAGGAMDIVTTSDDATGNIELDADGNITLDANGNIYLEAAGDTISCDSNLFKIWSVTTQNPIVEINSTTADATAGILKFSVDKHSGGVGADGDDIGTVLWSADDAGGAATNFASIVGEISEADNTDEAGKLTLNVAENDGTLTAGLVLEGEHATDGEVDVTIASGTASTTTVAGDLAITSRLTCKSRTLDQTTGGAGAVVGEHDGDVVYFGDTTGLTTGLIYLYTAAGSAWVPTNADAVATADGLLGVALGGASDTNGMLIRGFVTLNHDPGSVADVLYLQSDNAGDVGKATVTAPSASGDCVRVIGYQVNHGGSGNIWFNPDSTFVEVA